VPIWGNSPDGNSETRAIKRMISSKNKILKIMLFEQVSELISAAMLSLAKFLQTLYHNLPDVE
jgi:hypothetical protein